MQRHLQRGNKEGDSAMVAEMRRAAAAFLGGLAGSQRQRCVFAVDSDERHNWDYRPKPRAGLALAEMDQAQRLRALSLMASGLSRTGNTRALDIMSLERVLGELEGPNHHTRDPGLYFLTIFGSPEADATWGWRVEGHHLSVNFLIRDNTDVACFPLFFGANPAKVPTGPLEGFVTLPREEEAARTLLNMLDENQKAGAVIDSEAPADIVTGWAASIRLDEPVGIGAAELDASQKQALWDLLLVYIGRMAPELARAERAQVEDEGFDSIHFAWAGAAEPGGPHYYRLHGPLTVVEYDNVQNNANHIHTVWRNLKRDWGGDMLRGHYADSHG